MQWEYITLKYKATGFMGGKVDEDDISRLLNLHGRDGWELVSTMDTNMADGQTRYLLFYLKRPLA
ncbi:MAG: DUF4177 domain-containing protein [Planctomycetota bacterium]